MQSAPLTEDVAAGADWLAMHIFYASNPNPLLVECVGPLVDDLRARGLIRRYFFIRYWQEGPHVRLRFLPTRPEDRAEIQTLAEAAVDRFLASRPALFSLDHERVATFHKDMFTFEYGEEEWERQYGDAGMPVRANNSYDYIPYQPEYDRYGGPKGVALAEWHFEQSSDMVLRLLASANVHVRTVMFGLSAQLSLTMGYTFRPSGAALARFFHYYCEFWSTAYPDPLGDQRSQYDKSYRDMASVLVPRVAEISRATLGGERGRLARFIRDWEEHCRKLRDRIAELSVAGDLVFRAKDSDQRREPVTDPDIALGILLSGYVHMTNNRLGVGVHDEAYLAYVLRQSLMDIHGLDMNDMAVIP
jgi:hypothetical protein